MRNIAFLVVVVILVSCGNTCQSGKGEIVDLGVYCLDEKLGLEVYNEEGYLKYLVFNREDDKIIFEQTNDISIYTSWGLFFDNEGNLWVFSNDIGNSIWELDKQKNQYSQKFFSRQVFKSEVPQEIYESSLKKFIK